jgi:hypothetical protein
MTGVIGDVQGTFEVVVTVQGTVEVSEVGDDDVAEGQAV